MDDATPEHSLRPVGIVHSPFAEKFGVPRQPGIAPSAVGRLDFLPPFDDPEALRGLEEFSHVWLIFLAHRLPATEGFQPTVRPPRLGGNVRRGVFATRSLFRPNRLGLSLVKLEGVDPGARPPCLHLSGLDLIDGTPVVDIKPYIPYVESPTDTRGGFAHEPPPSIPVHIATEARPAVEEAETRSPGFQKLLFEVLAADPRPAYRRDEPDTTFTFTLARHEVSIRAENDGLQVISVVRISKTSPPPHSRVS